MDRLDTGSAPAAQETAAPPGLLEIFLAFAQTGLSSIGGGLSGWMMREFVHKRRWMSEAEFLSGLALAQAFPGVNVVNLAIWIGFRLRGSAGAVLATLGVVIPTALVAVALVSVFDQLARYHLATALLAGAASAAIGLSLSMGLRALRAAAVHVIPTLVVAATFIALFVMQWPLLPVLLVIAPISIALAFWRLRREGRPS